ncbi:DUF1223 domain-containing protein [Terrimonas sp. NA20]|uniref:DUF1223 domain-containing protein n=1 Tax=Terrimonas ginsenosidimutans TaxID=2908004 RepID=A0ABS9KVJ0_9BACT|nr:DUF1223 domain-containing protein [Terrimonas ginsenosidimutans]MCG2616328.1 DUF1223 domain-containing protein [Terrimonas ginsenosidimutans]
MKLFRIPFIIVITSLVLTGLLFANKTDTSEAVPAFPEPGFALLELFTSEGCSSCPPADELMNRIQQSAGDKPVYVLAYHVDYWDRNGWKDVFSDPAFTERQYQYSRRFADQVYTPQVIVNGTTEFVGSDAEAADIAISKALATSSAGSLSVTASIENDSLKASYQVESRRSHLKLMIAVVQKHATSGVKAGENKGRTLSHSQIVRRLHSFDIDVAPKNQFKLELPRDFNINEWELIGFLQDRATGVIYAAKRITI